jgi:hypothetical protein
MAGGKRIPDLPSVTGAGTASDDNLVIFDTDANATKRISRSQLATGIVGDLPYTPSGGIAATTVPTAIAELDSEAAKSAALAAAGGAALIGNTPAGTIAATTVQGAINEIVSDLAASSGSSLVGYTQAGTGAATRTAQAKLREVVSAADFGAVGDGSDEQAKLQAAIDYLVSLRGGTLLLDPTKTYKIGSAIDVGTSVSGGIKVCIDGQGGAVIEALTAFTGGMLVVGSASEVRNLWGTGAGYTTPGHCFIYCGTATYFNVSPVISNVRSNGGFYDFVSSDYELDGADIDVTSFFPVGRSVFYSGTHPYAPSAGMRLNVNARGATATPTVGSPRTTCIYIATAESSRITFSASYFDTIYELGSSCRDVEVVDALALEFRGSLFSSKWAATTAYTAGQFIAPTNARANGYFYLCTTSGTSGATEPTWPTTYNGTVTDGTVVWTEIGQSVVGKHANAKQTAIRSSRFEDFNVCLLGFADNRTSVHDSRFVGDCSYVAYTNTSLSSLVATNNTLAGDLRLNSTIPSSGGKTQFSGINNAITGDTAAIVPNHAQSVYSTQPYQAVGVKFPSTAVASTDVNTLDDYEEGAWTATIVSSANYTSVTFVDGTYVKIGKLVTIFGQFTGSVTTTATTTWVQFESIPFNQAAGASRAVGTSSMSGNSYAAGAVIDASPSNSNRFIAGMDAAGVVGTGTQTMTFTITYESV